MGREPEQNNEELSDEVLWENARLGLQEAWDVIVERHTQTMYVTAYSRMKNRAKAEEAVQDAFLLAFINRDDFDPGRGSLVAWLRQQTKISAYNAYNSQIRGPRSHAALSEYNEPVCRTAPHELVSQKEDEDRLQRAIDKLPREKCELFMLRVYDGLSFKQIGKLLNIEENTANMRFDRIVRLLKKQCGEIS